MRAFFSVTSIVILIGDRKTQAYGCKYMRLYKQEKMVDFSFHVI
jgi:hypothetical protein